MEAHNGGTCGDKPGDNKPPISLYNTLKRCTQPFEPLVSGKAGFYGCGPTVYNYAHIGNLRAYVTHDVLIRTLRRFGYEATHVMNITDVGHLTGDNDEGEDKMLKSAEERGKSVLEIADYYTQAFFKDTDRLNIIRPGIVCKATEHIQEMIDLIKRIEERGFTYVSGGNVYFDISRFPTYGDLGLLRLDDLKAGARVSADEKKRNPGDFVLWFTNSKFENQALVWDSPWGRGYPGWHIECSAMSGKYLTDQFDIHAGGIDHIPVHHTNEIAQSEAASGKSPWVKYWVHNEFLVMDKGKMSKSSGSFLTLQTLIDDGYDPLDYRYFLLGGHYRSQLQFSYAALDSAKNARKSLCDRIRFLAREAAALPAASSAPGGESGEKAAAYLANFDLSLADDISTPRALADLWGLVKDSKVSPAHALAGAFDMDGVLGLNLKEESSRHNNEGESPELAAEVERLIGERSQAKAAKDFSRADAIRQELKEKGILLEDSPSGTSWRRA
ncbi:MAG: cysteine--tRNA ligase [Treponema sp.]|jgi:cysteinyl-tRNA synthetase|nr:cysteine--tRNA ligase [Treponema sp.]